MHGGTVHVIQWKILLNKRKYSVNAELVRKCRWLNGHAYNGHDQWRIHGDGEMHTPPSDPDSNNFDSSQ